MIEYCVDGVLGRGMAKLATRPSRRKKTNWTEVLIFAECAENERQRIGQKKERIKQSRKKEAA